MAINGVGAFGARCSNPKINASRASASTSVAADVCDRCATIAMTLWKKVPFTK